MGVERWGWKIGLLVVVAFVIFAVVRGGPTPAVPRHQPAVCVAGHAC